MKYPNTETGIYELAQSMSNGLADHAADFPSLDPVALDGALANYVKARQGTEFAKSGAKVAVATKADKLSELSDMMKNMLKKAEVDVAVEPAKLAEIGWGSRSEPTPISVPNAPSDLTAYFEGQSALSLDLEWKRPLADQSRPVVNYIIERRDKGESGEFGDWRFVDMVYKPAAHLIGQPKGISMEYRVKASNGAGTSPASNSVAVIL